MSAVVIQTYFHGGMVESDFINNFEGTAGNYGFLFDNSITGQLIFVM